MKRIAILLMGLLAFCATESEKKTPEPAKIQQKAAVGPGFLGIRYASTASGLHVYHVFPDSPAARAGLLPGDLITSANGRPVSGSFALEFRRRIMSLRDGALLRLKITRYNGTETVIDARIREAPGGYNYYRQPTRKVYSRPDYRDY